MYSKLILKPIPPIIQYITEQTIIDIVDKCFDECAFSIFPYILNKLNSSQSIDITKSGDCVSLSMYIQKKLKKLNIKSYLVPATIPKKYQLPAYLEISHVALAIPINNNEIFLFDAAFYFLNPMHINLNQSKDTVKYVFSKNIYKDEIAIELPDYKSIDIVEYNLDYLTNDLILNEYQTIPKNTFFINSRYKNDPLDTWKYFLIEVINPDRAITTFFINIKKDPFITITANDKNGVCTLQGYLNIDNENIKVKLPQHNINFTKKISNLNREDINLINTFFSHYIGDIENCLITLQNLKKKLPIVKDELST